MLLNSPFNDDLNDDYRRLGIRRDECRQVIIRNAATRLAAPLASIVQHDPRDQSVTSTLSAVATSTYRLLDPRRRANAIERALVGRVSALELLESTERARETGQIFGRVAESRIVEARPIEARNANRDHSMPQRGHDWSRLVDALPRRSR